MAFKVITSSKWFHKLNNTLSGKIIIARGKRYVFNLAYWFIRDVTWQKIQHKLIFKKPLNLNNPITFAEKSLYLKLFYHNPLIHVCADKHFVKEYLSALGYEELMIPELGLYSNAKYIDFDNLPSQFIIKCTQGSSHNLIVDKTSQDYEPNKIIKYFNECLKLDYYRVGREYSYKGLSPKVLVQPIIRNNDGTLPIDYKFYCFEGELKYYMVSYGEYSHNVRNHKFDRNDQSIDNRFKKSTAIAESEIVLPPNIEEMKTIVERLARPFPHVRVDLYNVDGKIYFGELTFYSSGGFVNVYDQEMDKEIGSWINLKQHKDEMVFKRMTQKYRTAIL